jgi:aspartate kinase
VDDAVGRVSLIGSGIASQSGVTASLFAVLAAAGIEVRAVSSSPIRVTCLVATDDVEKAVRVLHDRFDPPTPVVEP